MTKTHAFSTVPARKIFLALMVCLSAASSLRAETAENSLSLANENPYAENATLAWFSVGALAVGGVLYAIQASPESSRLNYAPGSRSGISTAINVAGLTALVAGASYLFHAHQDAVKARAWDAQLSGGVAPNGGVNVAASVTLPLPN